MDLNQVTLPSEDLTKSVAFYEKMGFRLIVNAVPNYARFECPTGSSSFSLHLVDKIRPSDTYVYFEEENLDEKVKALQKKGIVFDEPPSDRSWGWREARLRDPDGNQLILFYGGENRLNPPWRVK